MSKKRFLPPRVSSFRDRHGKTRYTFRRGGHTTRYFKSQPGTKDFLMELAAFEDANAQPVRVADQRREAGTICDLVRRYFESNDFSGSAVTKLKNRGILESFREKYGEKTVRNLTFEHIDVIIAVKAKTHPAAARNLRKQLRRLFRYAVKIRMRPDNPVDLTVPIKGKVRKHGIHAWTEIDIEKYRSHWPLSTRQRLALELILWTDQRKGDAIALGPKNMDVIDGVEFFRLEQEKTGKCLRVKVSPVLREAIDAMAVTGTETFLLNSYGKPFTAAGFGMRFRAWCNEADLKHCSAHGLRKAGARRAADVGATQQQLKALGGWANDKEVATYVESANQFAMNAQVIDAVTNWELSNQRAKLDKADDNPL